LNYTDCGYHEWKIHLLKAPSILFKNQYMRVFGAYLLSMFCFGAKTKKLAKNCKVEKSNTATQKTR